MHPRFETGYDAHCWASYGYRNRGGGNLLEYSHDTVHSMDMLSFGRSSSSSLALDAAISSISGSRGAVLTRYSSASSFDL